MRSRGSAGGWRRAALLRQCRRQATRTGFPSLSIRVVMDRACSGARCGWWHSRSCVGNLTRHRLRTRNNELPGNRPGPRLRRTIPSGRLAGSPPRCCSSGLRRSPGRHACSPPFTKSFAVGTSRCPESQKSAASAVLVGAFRSSPPRRLPSGLAIAKIECGDGKSTGAQFSRIPRRNASARG